MTRERSLLPTATSSVGMLVGGLLGTAVGYFIGTEAAVTICFASGFILGSAIGGRLGYMWEDRRARSATVSE